MYNRFTKNTEDKKINIDDVLDGLSAFCNSYKNTADEYNQPQRTSRRSNHSSQSCVYNEDTNDSGDGKVINITVRMPNIINNINVTSSKKSSRQREYDDYDRQVDQAWRNFYAANS